MRDELLKLTRQVKEHAAWLERGQVAGLPRPAKRTSPTTTTTTGLKSLQQVREELGDCTRCKLHPLRKNIVFGVGNPNAPLKLVEFGSISCPHCAEFNERAGGTLRSKYVRSGRVSWEYRPVMIFPTDPGVFLLLSCLGPGSFFPTTDQLYAQQHQWVGKLQDVSQEEQQRIQGLPMKEQAAALVLLRPGDRARP